MAVNNKFYQGRLNSQMAQTSAQADQYNRIGQGALNNIVNPGLTKYNDLLGKLSNPDRYQRTSDDLENQLNQYSGQVSGMFNNAGYSPEEKAGMRYATAAPIAGAYAGAQQDLARKATVTNNPAAYGAQMGQMARQRSADTSAALGGLQGNFGQARIQGQQFATNASQFVPQQEQTYAGQQQNLAQQFQFAPGLGANVLQTGAGASSELMGQNAGMTNSLGGVAAQPGFWSRLLQAGGQTAASYAGHH